MNSARNEKYQQVIQTIGQDKIEQLYLLLGNERISMATLKKIVFKEEIKKVATFKKSVTDISRQLRVSRMTIYRQRKGL